jgi:endonuclease/exonuclease/phosphatase family metal-dependent hydrolase
MAAESRSLPEPAGGQVLRVLSYNLRSLRDDRAAVHRVIRSTEADVVCIQEAPRFWRPAHQATRLAGICGLRVIAGGRPAAANLILGRPGLRVSATRDVLLSRDRRLHQRGVTIACFAGETTEFAIAGTHLDVEEPARLRHAAEVNYELARFAAMRPTVLAGDFNDDPGTPVWRCLLAGRVDAFAEAGTGDPMTSSVGDPRRRIDAIMVGAGFEVLSCQSLDSADVRRASDHRPVLAVLRLTPGGSPPR